MEQAAKKKDNQLLLLNGVIKLVFGTEQLAKSTGLGLKCSKENTNPLDAAKVQAVKGRVVKLFKTIGLIQPSNVRHIKA